MKKYMLLFLCLNALDSLAQEGGFFKKYPFVHQTSLQVLAGRDRAFYDYSYRLAGLSPSSYYYPQQRSNSTLLNLGLETFNGLRIKKNTAVGFAVGMDSYSHGIIVPLSASVRQIIIKKGDKGAKLQASIDAGYGILGSNSPDSSLVSSGGLHVYPKLSFIFTGRNGSAFLVNFGYKYQYSSSEQSFVESPESFTKSEFKNKRFTIGIGFQF